MTNSPLRIDALLAAYRSGVLKPRDLVNEVQERIAARGDDAVWITKVSAEALEAAAARLEAMPDGWARLPLYGVPFAAKDNIDVAGLPTTAGCPAFAYCPQKSATVIAALEAAGAILIGKTNLDQFATGLVGVRSPYGIPRSVFSDAHISGGSSSGSAVAVAAGLVSFALGTDTAGSGRVPAAFNNIVGLKPSRGLISASGVVPACRSIDCVSIFACSTRDTDTVLRVAGIFDPGDPYARRAEERPLALEAPRIGILAGKDLEFYGDGEAQALYESACARIAALGGTAIAIDYAPLREAALLLYGPLVAERYAGLGYFFKSHAQDADPTVREIILNAAKIAGPEVFRVQERLQEIRRQADPMWNCVDALMLPTAPTTYRVDEVSADPIRLNARLGHYTNFVNLLDYAAVAVPAGFRLSGLPFGVTLIAPAGSDGDLVRLAGRFHTASDSGAGKQREAVSAADEPDARVGAKTVIELAVVGAHLQGQPLNHELTSRGAGFRRRARTAANYRLYALAGTKPPKPGLVRASEPAGAGIELEIWALTLAAFGSFTANVPAPMAIGTVSLADGMTVKGFVCEPAALQGARDITEFGGWRAYLESLKSN
jgi:allophanate hydrolase